MTKFKYHVGFPVDCEGSETPPYFLLYPAKNCSKHYVSTPHSKNDEFDPPHWGEISKHLKICQYFDFHCSIGNFNFSGNSCMLAYAIAGNSQNIANPEDKNCPHLFFSSSIKVSPKATYIYHATIDNVTDDDHKAAEKSLRNKWETILRIHHEKKKTALFLHQKDWKKLKRLLNQGIYIEKHLRDLTSEKFYKEIRKANVPLVVAVGSEDICKLLEILEIEIKNESSSQEKSRTRSLDEKLKINEGKEKIKKIVEKEILKLEKELLDEEGFEKFIKDTVIKTIKESGVTKSNILLKKEAFKKSIEKNIVPKMNEYLESRMNQYSENIKKEVTTILLENIDLSKMRVGDNVSSEASSSVAASIGTAIASAVGTAIASQFLNQAFLIFFSTTNPAGWVAMIVSALICAVSAGKIGLSSLEKKIIKIIGPSKNFFRNGILYDLWHEGFEDKGIEALKKEREKDYERIISELEKNEFKDLL